MNYEAEDFLHLSKSIPIIDVRTPKEFNEGHIPGAYNLPLFTDEERVVVGTIYKKIGKKEAVLEGLKIVGPKMADFVVKANKISVDNKILVHCWRGGMRSSSMAWLLNTSGLEANVLSGGYKAYRSYIRTSFSRPQIINILGGMTGSNKTEILKSMHLLGEQFIDLEGLAVHKGSSFGQIGLPPQPTNEQFENNIAAQWLNLNQNKPVWFEDESQVLGTVAITRDLYLRIRNSTLFILQKDKQLRIKHLVEDYSSLDIKKLEEALLRIRKRLGENNMKEALEALKIKDFEKVVDISLVYYDKTYMYGIEERENVEKHYIKSNFVDPTKNAELILEFCKTNIPQ